MIETETLRELARRALDLLSATQKQEIRDLTELSDSVAAAKGDVGKLQDAIRAFARARVRAAETLYNVITADRAEIASEG
jgi:hypothetical protein